MTTCMTQRRLTQTEIDMPRFKHVELTSVPVRVKSFVKTITTQTMLTKTS